MTVFFHSELSASILAESSHFFRRTPGFLAGDTASCKQDRDVLAALHGQRLAGAPWGGADGQGGNPGGGYGMDRFFRHGHEPAGRKPLQLTAANSTDAGASVDRTLSMSSRILTLF